MFRRAFLRTLKRLIWSITVFILILGRSNISASPKSVILYYLYKFQNCVEKLQSRTIFCVSFGMFSESDVSITTTILGVSLFEKS